MSRALPMPAGMGNLPSAMMLLISIICLGLSAFKPHLFDNARSGAQEVLSPVLTVISMPFQKGAGVLRDVSGLASLQATNARLEEENARLREWYHAALLMEAENKSLRDLLNLKMDTPHTHVTARIIADSGSAYVKSLLLDAGQKNGVLKGQAVLSGEGIVGRIIEASESSSRVLLVTDMNSRVPIMVSDTMQHAIMAGTNTDQPKLIHMPQDSEMEDGAHIVTSGYGGIFPAGLPVGKVVTDDGGVKRIALFSNIGRMQFVRVVQIAHDPGAGGYLIQSANQ